MRFHRKCGDRVTLLNENRTAIRNFVEFNHGLILSAEPLPDDVLFEVCVDRKVNVWNGSLEVGVTTQDPEYIELPATATKLRNTAWILSGSSVVRDGVTLVNSYGPELDTLREGDFLGVMRTHKAELMFYVNGRCLGVAATNMPSRLFAVIDLYGQCVQVTIMSSEGLHPPIDTLDEIEEDTGAEGDAAIEDLGIDETLTSIELDVLSHFMSTHNQESPTSCHAGNSYKGCSTDHHDTIRFHSRCGILVKLSGGNKSAERTRPLDDCNNGVVITHRPLLDDELFEIRIDKLVDKWSGSIEVGVTTHNPSTIRFPSTMTNMDTGTIMMSGCKVLINGHGTCMEYGNFNLDELREGDTVGLMRRSNGKLHYFINGIDQGVAAERVDPLIWGVVDLYGMTVKVTIVDPCVDNNIEMVPASDTTAGFFETPRLEEDSLLFHTLRDSNVIVIGNNKTAHRPNAFELFNNGVVMTNRTLKTNELFQVRLDLVIPKWAGSIEIGVTQLSCNEIEIPFKMSNAKSGTWAMTGEDIIHDGTIVIPQYVRNLNRLVEGDTVGVMRKEMGILHFFVNGIDQGPAAFNVPEHVFGIVDLYGRVAQVTIVEYYMPIPMYSPDSPISSESNATVYPEMCFHRVHGRNARLSRSRLTASRATVFSEFNDAVLFSSRPLRECEMFELRIDRMVDCWIGSLEIGVTGIKPEQLDANGGVGAVAGTATDLSWDTYILSGAAIVRDGECVRGGYALDLDTLTVGSRVGLMWHADRSLHYYLDGMDQGKAWYVPHLNIYAVVDLYGQCTQVTILQNEERQFNYNGCTNSDNSIMINPRSYFSPAPPYCFSEYCGENVILMHDYTHAKRLSNEPTSALVFSAGFLCMGEMFEIKIVDCEGGTAGGLRMGVTDINILNAHINRCLPPSIAHLPHFTAFIDGKYLRYTNKNGSRKHELRSVVPTFEWLRPGDRIGLKKISDSKVLVYYNSEQLDMVIENVPNRVYVVMELYGNVSKIQAISKLLNIGSTAVQHQPPAPVAVWCSSMPSSHAVSHINIPNPAFTNSPLTPISSPLPVSSPELIPTYTNTQAKPANTNPVPICSPEKTAPICSPDQLSHNPPISSPVPMCSPEPVSSTAPTSSPEPASNSMPVPSPAANTFIAEGRKRRRPLPYTFHYLHGKNIKLCSSDTVAIRTTGYDDGLAVVSQPLRRGNNCRFRIDKINEDWSGTVSVGAVPALPFDPLPRNVTMLEYTSWFVSSELIGVNGKMHESRLASVLEQVKDNSVLTIHFWFNSDLVLEVDNVLVGKFATIPLSTGHVFPLIDLYGKVCQASILLHPHIVVGGASIDLPIITETHGEESFAEMEHAAESERNSRADEQQEKNLKGRVRSYSQENINNVRRENVRELLDFGANQPNDNNVTNQDLTKEMARATVHRSYSSLVLANIPDSSVDNMASECPNLAPRAQMDQDDDDNRNAEDTNIRHNDRYPEASEVDNLDSEIINALTMDAATLPDLTEEQTSSMDESLTLDHMWYLNMLLNTGTVSMSSDDSDDEWELSADGCEYLHLVLKFWNSLTSPRPELRRIFAGWSEIDCRCVTCCPDQTSPFAGWIRVSKGPITENDDAERPSRRYWHVDDKALFATSASSRDTSSLRPSALSTSPPIASPSTDVWLDEEGKPHSVIIALEVEVGNEPSDDNLQSVLVYLRSLPQSPTSL